MDKVLDIHFHLPMINPSLKDLSNLNFLQKVGIRVFAKNLGIKYSNDTKKVNQKCKDKVTKLVNESKVDHVVLLGLDARYDNQGKLIQRKSIIYACNKDVYELAKSNDKILAGPSINPKRKDAKKQLEIAYDNKAALIKQLPGLQDFLPKKYKQFYRLAAKLKLPILLHVGQEHSTPGTKLNKQALKIDNLIPALDAGCTVIAPHGGGYSLFNDKKEFEKINYLLKKYPNLYLDNSALSTPHRRGRFFTLLQNKLALSRTLFGTDYPVYCMPFSFIDKIGLSNSIKLSKIKNQIDIDIELKKLIGYPNKSFSLGYDVINKESLKQH